MRYLLLLAFVPFLVLGVVGFNFTSGKLYRMKQIRGWEPGARVEQHVIRDRLPPEDYSFWISFTDKDVRTPGNHRMNLPNRLWEQYPVGAPIEIVFLPGNPRPYHRDGIYAEDGNFALDRAVLVVEGGMIAFSIFGAAFTAVLLRVFGRRRLQRAEERRSVRRKFEDSR